MRKVVLAALAALTALAVPAFAAPARTATLSAATPSFAWDGGPGTGHGPGEAIPFGYARCSAVYQCEDSLFEIKDSGTLTIEIKAGEGSEDLDLRLYKSDPEGGHEDGGTPIPTDDPTMAEDITAKADAKITVKNIKPGWYKAQVAFYKATNGVYKGTAVLTGAGAAPVPVTPPSTTTPPATTAPTPSNSSTNSNSRARAKAAYKRCVKKAKKVKSKKKRAKALKKCRKRKR